jgi:cytosine/adenosine deaminase-related metal-dependent hydrolase
MSIKVYTADWLLPVSEPPIMDGALAIDGEKIVDLGPSAELLSRLAAQNQDYSIIELGQAAILPGLVNTHSHLELTIMRGFLEGLGFRDWIVTLTGARRQLNDEHLIASAVWGACEAVRAGITTLADTGKSGTPLDGMKRVGLRGIVYQEVFGLLPSEAEGAMEGLKREVERLAARTNSLVRIGVSPHAPFSVSGRLFGAVARYAVAERRPMAIHCAESEAEELLIRDGSGEFGDNLRNRGIEWEPPGCSIIEYLSRVGALDASPLLIHCVRLADGDFSLITGSNSAVAHCPKSNAKFGHGRAQLRAMMNGGVRVGLGTDSVASNNVCDLLDEARVCAFIHGTVEGEPFDARAMIEMMTRRGAEALGMADEIGTLEPGKQADFMAIDLTDSRLLPVHDIEAAVLYCAAARDVCLTVVAGRELFRDGIVTGVDERAVRTVLESGVERITTKTQRHKEH